jgi:hypothetical protein
VNDVSPVSVLIDDQGQYVVTFDNWHQIGYGDDVVTIDRSDGHIVRKYGLAELLSQEELDELPRTISSILWRGEHALDASAGELVVRVKRTDRHPERVLRVRPRDGSLLR